jgi:16S rRNA (guanine966-N2)-methyltransferase
MAQDAIEIVKKNISKIKPQNIEDTLIRIIKADARKPFKNINLVFDIVFIDPPYNSNIIQECLINLKEHNLINADSVIFAETSKNEILDLPDFEILETKTYGKSKLTIIKLLELSSIK